MATTMSTKGEQQRAYIDEEDVTTNIMSVLLAWMVE